MTYEVGKSYYVDCVWDQDAWTPVIGPPHTDASHCLLAPELHYHIDWRFVKGVAIPNTVVMSKGPRTKMLRECFQTYLPTISFPIPMWSMIQKWGKEKQNCKICPHKGMPLTGIRPDENGFIRCPGHGLRFDPMNQRLAFVDQPWQVRIPGYPETETEFTYPIKVHGIGLPEGGIKVNRLVVSCDGIFLGPIELEHTPHLINGDKLIITGKHCKEGDFVCQVQKT